MAITRSTCAGILALTFAACTAPQSTPGDGAAVTDHRLDRTGDGVSVVTERVC